MTTAPNRPVIGTAGRRLADLDEYTFLERVPISLMFVAPYQRPIGETQIARMLRSGFNARKLGIITLSLRNSGRYAILDGNHRTRIAVNHGFTEMLSRVFIDLSYEEEAELFEALNTIKAPGALDRFRARLEYREPRAVAIQTDLGTFGLRIAVQNGGNQTGIVTCVAALDKLYIERGPLEFNEVLNVITQAWGIEDPTAWTGRIVDGFRMFWSRYRDLIEFQRLVLQLRNCTPRTLLVSAGANPKNSDSASALIGRQIAILYSGRSRSGKNVLPPWTNYVKSATGERKEAPRTAARKLLEKARGKRAASGTTPR